MKTFHHIEQSLPNPNEHSLPLTAKALTDMMFMLIFTLGNQEKNLTKTKDLVLSHWKSLMDTAQLFRSGILTARGLRAGINSETAKLQSELIDAKIATESEIQNALHSAVVAFVKALPCPSH